MGRFSMRQQVRNPQLQQEKHRQDSSTITSISSYQWGEPPKKPEVPHVKQVSFKTEISEEPQQPEGYPSAAYPSMMPMAPGLGMPQMMYMMPSNCGPMTPSNYYNCNTGRSSSSYGSHSGRESQHELNDTFESVTSFDSAICAKPCEGVGRFLGKTVNGFLTGCGSVLDYGENLCGENLCSRNSLVKNPKANVNLPTEMIASTPHPQPENESLTEKMDELLKLLKDKESSVGSVSRSESSGIVAHSPQDPKTKAKKAPRDDIGDQADRLIEMFKNMNPDNNFNGLNESIEMLENINPINNFNGLNESAISKVSEMISIGQDLVLDPTVDFETDAKPPKDATLTPTKSLLDETSFELNAKDISITWEVEPEPEKKSDGKPSGRPPLPIASAATAKKMNDASEKENKASSQIDSNAPTTKTIKAQANMKMKSFRGRRVKKMLKDIKNVPKMNKNASKKARAVNITVEDRRNSSSEKISFGEEHFVANFSSEAAVDSMGFPVSPTQSDDDKKKEKGSSWENNFICKDNPFASKDPVDASSETRICEWCRKGGTTDAEIVKKLKLCSRCQATYYCSPECQSKDWINGHAKTCQPNSVTMY